MQTGINYFNLCEKPFEGREKMLMYYTGLESIAVFNLIAGYIKPGLTSKIVWLSFKVLGNLLIISA